MKTYKYRIYPSKAQTTRLNETLALCCELYNAALQERRDAWRIAHKSVRCFDQLKQVPEIKAIRPELGMVHSQVLQDALRRLDKAFEAFFRRIKAGEKPGYPRFRARAQYDSITYPQAPPKGGFRFKNGKLNVTKIGDIKIKLHRPIE